MIVVLTVETNSLNKEDIGSKLVNAELFSEAITVETTKTQFKYPFNFRDRREKPALIKTTEAITSLRAAANLAPTTPAITLAVHSDLKNPASAIVNTDFMVRDIQWGTAYAPDPTKSYVYVLQGGFRVKKLLVNSTLAAIVALVTI